MRRMLFSAVPIMMSLFILSAFSVKQYQALAGDAQSLKVAPDFTISDIHGNPLRLSDFKGKVILIDFWATWCPFCRESIPILKSLYDEYKDKGLVVIGIALEYDRGQALKQLAKEKKISYPLAVGKERLATEYSAYGVPTRFIVNRAGEIEKKFVGFQDREILESALREFL